MMLTQPISVFFQSWEFLNILCKHPDGRERNDCYILLFGNSSNFGMCLPLASLITRVFDALGTDNFSPKPGQAKQDSALVNNGTAFLMSWLAEHRPEIKSVKVPFTYDISNYMLKIF